MALPLPQGAAHVKLEALQKPLRDAFDANMDCIFEIVRWLEKYPAAHPDERKAKFELWRRLSDENGAIIDQENENRDAWLVQLDRGTR